MGRDRKAQLGARVPDVVRQMAVEQAAARGVSLNQHIEWLIREAATTIELPVRVDETLPLGTALVKDGDEVVATITGIDTNKLDVNCSLRDYHWRCSPGNPCRRCGGET